MHLVNTKISFTVQHGPKGVDISFYQSQAQNVIHMDSQQMGSFGLAIQPTKLSLAKLSQKGKRQNYGWSLQQPITQ